MLFIGESRARKHVENRDFRTTTPEGELGELRRVAPRRAANAAVRRVACWRCWHGKGKGKGQREVRGRAGVSRGFGDARIGWP